MRDEGIGTRLVQAARTFICIERSKPRQVCSGVSLEAGGKPGSFRAESSCSFVEPQPRRSKGVQAQQNDVPVLIAVHIHRCNANDGFVCRVSVNVDPGSLAGQFDAERVLRAMLTNQGSIRKLVAIKIGLDPQIRKLWLQARFGSKSHGRTKHSKQARKQYSKCVPDTHRKQIILDPNDAKVLRQVGSFGPRRWNGIPLRQNSSTTPADGKIGNML